MASPWSTRAYTGEAIRAAEQRALEYATEAELMDRAAHAVAWEALAALRGRHAHARGTRAVVLAGSGKNGGDALLAGVHLLRAGVIVDAVLCADSAFEPALAAFSSAGGAVVHAVDDDGIETSNQTLAKADAVIDGIVGIGARPGLREPALTLAAAIPATAVVVAVDIASGVDIDTGETPAGFIAADVTVTFSAPKPCHLLPPAAVASGRVVVAPVGIPLDGQPPAPAISRATEADVSALWPMPKRTDHKYSRGVLGVVAGSEQYPGGAVLAVSGAWRTGAGMVRYWGPRRSQDLVLAARPETVCHDEGRKARVQAWLIGPGLAQDRDETGMTSPALESGLPGIADAGAIVACAQYWAGHARTDQPGEPLWVVTPHAGELAEALTALGTSVTRADVEEQPVHYARALAEHARIAVLLKGPVTLVCHPNGDVVSQTGAPAWLATAGAGDVLAGVIGSLLAAGVAPWDAAVMGAYVHAHAASEASQGGPIVALDVAEALPQVVSKLQRARRRREP